MKIIHSQKMLCPCCMEDHDVQIVRVNEVNVFKSINVSYDAEYYYCDKSGETYADEKQFAQNDIAMKNAYRSAVGLLTSEQIAAIRSQYQISQNDLCLLLGWGAKTITRYESHQVQDNAHDTILRKLSADPEWFLALLKASKGLIAPKSYAKYREAGTALFEQNHDLYLKSAIMAKYARLEQNPEYTGNTVLSLDKVVDTIRYYANSQKVINLYKVKLMKMLWYADALSYKRREAAISGMIYCASPMGALPIAHELFIDLSAIHYEEIELGDATGYRFFPTPDHNYPHLSKEDISVLNTVIDRFGNSSRAEIVETMHQEDAYIKTAPGEIIPFKYAKTLSIS